MIFEIVSKTEIVERFDRYDEFWERFGVQGESLKKQLCLNEIELIINSCKIVVAVNSKEYFKQFENLASNKKHKGIRKNTAGMNFENYADRILSFSNHENIEGRWMEKQEQQGFQVLNGKMKMVKVTKSKSAINNSI